MKIKTGKMSKRDNSFTTPTPSTPIPSPTYHNNNNNIDGTPPQHSPFPMTGDAPTRLRHDYDILIKLLTLGDSSVGKTSLLCRYR
jgi:hypothetical protein